MVASGAPGPYCPVLWELPLAALPGTAALSSRLPLFKNKKGTELFLCIFGGILLGDVCFDFEGFFTK